MAFNSRKVDFCGKQRTFKRCPNRTLKDYQSKIEDLQEELKPITDDTRELQHRIDQINDELEVIEDTLKLSEKLSEASDAIIIENMQFAKKKLELKDKLYKIEVEANNKFGEQKKFFEEVNKKLDDSYAQFATLIFKDFKFEEYEEEADSKDALIAPRLGELYRVATSGVSQSEVDKLYNDIISEASSFQSRND